MKQYQKLFIGLSLLTFISCGSSGGGGHDNATNVTPKAPVNGEVLKKGEISTAPIVAGNGETQISNGNTKIDDKTKVAVMAENGGKITNGTDAIISGIFAVGIEASGTGSEVANNGKVIGGSNEDIARSVVPSYNQEINSIGMEALNGGKAVNNGEISGKLSEGIVANGKGSTAINNGKVTSTGVKYTDSYTNEDGIKFNETGISAIGMKASNGASIINGENGIIFGTIGEVIIAEGQGSTAINSGKVTSTGAQYDETYIEDGIKHNGIGTYSTGMKASNGADVLNKKGGVISGSISTGMKAEGLESTAINNGEINSTGVEYTDTYTDKDGILRTNSGTSAKGMRAKNGASVTNNGTISGVISEGMRAQDSESTAINNGKISSTGTEWTNTYTDENGVTHIHSGTHGIGMMAREGAKLINEETGVISGTISEGMRAQGEGASAVNSGKISSTGSEWNNNNTDEDGSIHTDSGINGGTGISAREGASVINEENGTISGIINKGINAQGEGSTGINNGDISSIGIKYTDSYTDKDGIIHTYPENDGGIGMEAREGATVTNGKTGTISGIIEQGMNVEGKGSTAVNNGEISSLGIIETESYNDKEGNKQTYKNITGGTGMESREGSIFNNGIISGTLSYGMDATGEGSTAVNNGTINFDGLMNTSYYSNEDGTISINKDIHGIGMFTYDGKITNGETGIISGALVSGMEGMGTNLGIITIEQIKDEIPDYLSISGMKVFNGVTAINAKTGTINLNSRNGNGMYAEGTGSDENGQSTSIKSKIENSGTININAETGIGMKASWGATAINEETGIINLNSSNGIGMYGVGVGSTIENRGKIYLSGSEVTSSRDSQTAEEIATNSSVINGKDNKGNIGMKIESGARMINKGHIVFGK